MDLDSFLALVIDTAKTRSDDTSQEMAQSAKSLREHFTFLGRAEYEEACMGIAQMWQAYVRQSDEHVINLFNRIVPDAPDYAKSYNAVLEDIMTQFSRQCIDEPELFGRVKLEPRDWVDSLHAKLIVVDDWIVSGNTVNNLVAQAERRAAHMGLPGLAEKLEAQILIARESQIKQPHSIGQGTIVYAVRGYYKIPDKGEGSVVSGFHSATDYGFEMPLISMADYLKRQDVYREPPLLLEIKRPYRHSNLLYDAENVRLLTAMAELNGQLAVLQTKEAVLRRLAAKPMSKGEAEGLTDRLMENVGAFRTLDSQLTELAQEYTRRTQNN